MRRRREVPQARSAAGAKRRRRAAQPARSAPGAKRRRREAPQVHLSERRGSERPECSEVRERSPVGVIVSFFPTSSRGDTYRTFFPTSSRGRPK